MTRFRPSILALPFFTFCFVALSALPATAQHDGAATGHAPMQAEKQAPQPRAHLTTEELDALDKMSQEERQAFFNQRRSENEALSDSQRQARREARRAAFDALPAADQVTIKERTQKLIDNLYTAPPTDPKAGQAAEKKAAEIMKSILTSSQQATWKEIQKNNGKWTAEKKKQQK